MHIGRGGGSGWADRCEMQTGLWFLGRMTDRSGYGDSANEETWTAVQRASNICFSPPGSFIHSVLVKGLQSQELCRSLRIKLLTPYLRFKQEETLQFLNAGANGSAASEPLSHPIL